jgi:hypothetical protein
VSIEIGSEFSGIKISGEKSRQTTFSDVCDRGLSFMYTCFNKDEWNADDSETGCALRRIALTDELLQFHKDPDYEEEIGIEAGFGKYDSLLPYDYETDFVDALNPDEQIAMYAADSWEFVTIADNIILFRKPKWEA